MIIRIIQSTLTGLIGGLVFGAGLAALHAAGPGGIGAMHGFLLGAITGAVTGFAATLILTLAVMGIRKFRGQSDWSAGYWRKTGFLIGAAAVTLIHVIDTYIL